MDIEDLMAVNFDRNDFKMFKKIGEDIRTIKRTAKQSFRSHSKAKLKTIVEIEMLDNVTPKVLIHDVITMTRLFDNFDIFTVKLLQKAVFDYRDHEDMTQHVKMAQKWDITKSTFDHHLNMFLRSD